MKNFTLTLLAVLASLSTFSALAEVSKITPDGDSVILYSVKDLQTGNFYSAKLTKVDEDTLYLPSKDLGSVVPTDIANGSWNPESITLSIPLIYEPATVENGYNYQYSSVKYILSEMDFDSFGKLQGYYFTLIEKVEVGNPCKGLSSEYDVNGYPVATAHQYAIGCPFTVK